MKKLFFIAAITSVSFASASTISELSDSSFEEGVVLTECNTQSTQDADGDNISVTCCRTTYEEAYDCAAGKLRKLAMQPLGQTNSID